MRVTIDAVFSLGLREGLEAALIVALLASLARGTGETRRIATAVAAAVALSVLMVVTVRRLHVHLSDETLHTIKAIVAFGAVVVLISTVRWTASMIASAERADRFAHSGAIGSVAFLAVAREGVELAVLPGAGEQAATWGPGHLTMIAGVAVATLLGIGLFALFRLAPQRLMSTSAVLLTLIAAGMAAAALRSAQHALGWSAEPLFELAWVRHIGHAPQVLVKGVFGVHAAPSALEVIAYCVALAAGTALALSTLHGHPTERVDPGVGAPIGRERVLQ